MREPANLRPNQRVLVESPRGKVEASVFVTYSVQPGQVFMPMHYAETNQLTHPALRSLFETAFVQGIGPRRSARWGAEMHHGLVAVKY